MTSSQSAPRTVVILALAALALFALAARPALACPEITFDPQTGVAIAQPDLEAALAELSAPELISMADASR